ncbi:MAG: hypothetical protein Q9219_004682 [cf. Caloplaca sp. 3 TL-2023]
MKALGYYNALGLGSNVGASEQNHFHPKGNVKNPKGCRHKKDVNTPNGLLLRKQRHVLGPKERTRQRRKGTDRVRRFDEELRGLPQAAQKEELRRRRIQHDRLVESRDRLERRRMARIPRAPPHHLPSEPNNSEMQAEDDFEFKHQGDRFIDEAIRAAESREDRSDEAAQIRRAPRYRTVAARKSRPRRDWSRENRRETGY